ncbi:MAG: TetR/AcrR family transcriptional regulator [Pseudomonadota bacterium]
MATTRSNSSRERILECAEAVILNKGFTGTSIDDIIDKASITKGGFFYHFDGKTGLAEALVERFLVQDTQIFLDLFEEADELTEDPLHRLLIFLKLLAQKFGNMPETHPGCLVASFTYDSIHFNERVRKLIRTGLYNWRELIMEQLREIDEQYTMNPAISHETLADMFTVVIEGGIVLARNLDQNQLLADQILAYRSYVRMLYGAS